MLLLVQQYGVAQIPDTSSSAWSGSATTRVDTCQSTWSRYGYLQEASSIVRGSGIMKVVHLQYWNPETGEYPHIFIVSRNFGDIDRAYKTYFSDPLKRFDITDMRLYNDTCYFCGNVKMDEVERGRSIANYGVIGRFPVYGMYWGTDTLFYKIVKETSRLSRLAISRAVIDNKMTTVVSAIGNRFTTNEECLIEFTHEGSSSWKMKVGGVSYPNGIIFSDLLNTGDSITLLSQFKCGDNILPGSNGYNFSHQIFLLDRFGLGGCSSSYSTPGPYYMMQYLMPLSDNCSYHLDEAPMRLFHIEDLDHKFGVAFGVRKTSVNIGGIRLFTFHNARQYDSSIYYKTGIHPIIKDVGNLNKRKYLFVISTDQSHPKGVMSSPEFGGTSPNVTLLSSSSYWINSLAQRSLGDYVYMTGHNSSGEYMLYNQYGLNFGDPTCFDKEQGLYTVFPEKRADLLVVEWFFQKEKEIEWVWAELSPVETVRDTVCQKCLP